MRFVFVMVVGFAFALSHLGAWAQNRAADQAPRFALVIGNSNYPDNEAPLKDTISDARRMAEELRRDGIGFDVEVGENLTKDAMHRAFDRFYGKIKPGSVALVFFSGFAIQSNRQSYLIPVDGQIWTEADVRRDGIAVDTILNRMNSSGASVKIAVLDASRRNPFERRFRQVAAGLAPVIAPTGTLVMYSAAPSTVINDTGSDHRLFIQELVKEIRAQDSTGEEAFNRTRMGVSRASQGRQVPWFSSSLVTDFSFARQPGKAVAAAPATPAPVPAPAPTPAPRVEAAPAPQVASRPPAPPPGPTLSDPTPAPVPAPAPMAPAAEPRKSTDDLAIQDLNKRLQANPKDLTALYRRGQLLAKNEDYAAAVKDFDAFLTLNPKDAEALNNRCWLRAVLGEVQSALKDCNEALQLRPRFVEALDSRGFVKLKAGLPQNAIADYDAALQINTNKASALYGRGIAKIRSGNSTGGNSDVAAAKAINPRIAEEFAAYGIR